MLGSGTFIPGFEEQLDGAAAGEQRLVKVKFPEDYSATHLAGKDAEFDVTVKAVAAPKSLEIGEELAKKYGFETFDAMKQAVNGNLEADFHKVSRDRLKRALLDALDSRYSFDLPRRSSSRSSTISGASTRPRASAPASRSPKRARPKTRPARNSARSPSAACALAWFLPRSARSAGVTVEDKDLTEALVERARMFPGQEKQVWDFYRNNEQALAQLRAPIYEERVVDHLSKLIKITDKTVTKDELFEGRGRSVSFVVRPVSLRHMTG